MTRPPGAPPSLDGTLLEEARRNELALAYLRMALSLAVAGVQLGIHYRPGLGGLRNYPLTDAVVSLLWIAAAVALLLALRGGWYRRWLRYLVPVVDMFTIATAFFLVWYHLDYWGDMVPWGMVVGVAALCVFLAFTGALRLSRSGAVFSTALAIGAFAFVAAVRGLAPAYVALALVAILLTGILGVRVARMIHRAVEVEVQRATLDQEHRSAQLAVQARDEILRIVSHDLRNPLSRITMGTSMLEMQLATEGEPGVDPKHLSIMQRAARRMDELIGDLLNASRVESGRLPVEPVPQPVEPLVKEAAQMLEPLAAEKDIELRLDLTPNLPWVHADDRRVLQVLSNLGGNAMKFTPAGGRITLGADPGDNDDVMFRVVDTGPGIPPDQLEHLFGSYWQADSSDMRGLGLGLSIVKGIVAGHGGQVWVESERGAGTTFYFTLPAAADAPHGP